MVLGVVLGQRGQGDLIDAAGESARPLVQAAYAGVRGSG
jgi:hypothetical protein